MMHFTRLDDSPMFRKQLQTSEESAEALRERCLKFYKGCRKYTEGLGEAYDQDIAFASALESFGGGHDDPISVAVGGPVMAKFTITLREIGTYKEVLRSQVEHMLNDRLMQFVNIDLQDVKEVRKRFDKTSIQYDQARDKFLSLKKGTKPEIIFESEENLRNARSSFEQARFNLVTALSNIESKKKFEFLESVSGTMDAHLRYFKQGYELFLQMEPYIHQVLTFAHQSRERANYEQAGLADKMQEYRRQMESEYQHSLSDTDASLAGDGIQTITRSSHKIIEAAMQSTPKGKVQTIKQGYLLKRSSSLRSDWKRRYFVLDSRGVLYYYRKQWGKPSDEKTVAHHTVNLLTSTIKVDAEQSELRFCFRIISPSKVYTLQAENIMEQMDWVDKITGVITSLLNSQTPEQLGYSQRFFRSPGGSEHQRTASESSSFSSSSDFDHSTPEDASSTRSQLSTRRDGLSHSPFGFMPEMGERPIDILRRVAGNEVCADCNSLDPDWASLNLGILVCIECSGVHRNLGVHISKVRSLTLDVKVWEPSVINLFQSVGNEFANSVWEELLLSMPENERNGSDVEKLELDLPTRKPDTKDPLSIKEKYIYSKYMEKKFVLRCPEVDPSLPSVAYLIWNAVQHNNKREAYRLIITMDADVNTTYEEAMREVLSEGKGGLSLPQIAGELHGSGLAQNEESGKEIAPADTEGEIEVDECNLQGSTLLYLACTVGDLGMMELLLQYGAKVNSVDSLGRTPLHHCILRGRNECAKLLLARGANASAVEKGGKTALQIVMEMGAITDEELFLMLSEAST